MPGQSTPSLTVRQRNEGAGDLISLRLLFFNQPPLELQLESKLHRQLQLSGVAYALAQKTVKVK